MSTSILACNRKLGGGGREGIIFSPVAPSKMKVGGIKYRLPGLEFPGVYLAFSMFVISHIFWQRC